MIQWIFDDILEGTPLCFKTLESYMGYLVYISGTYPVLIPYLKGIHLTLDSWWPNRETDGWKLSETEIQVLLAEKHLQPHRTPSQAPSHITSVPQLLADIHAGFGHTILKRACYIIAMTNGQCLYWNCLQIVGSSATWCWA